MLLVIWRHQLTMRYAYPQPGTDGRYADIFRLVYFNHSNVIVSRSRPSMTNWQKMINHETKYEQQNWYVLTDIHKNYADRCRLIKKCRTYSGKATVLFFPGHGIYRYYHYAAYMLCFITNLDKYMLLVLFVFLLFFLVKSFSLCILLLLPFVVNKAYHAHTTGKHVIIYIYTV